MKKIKLLLIMGSILVMNSAHALNSSWMNITEYQVDRANNQFVFETDADNNNCTTTRRYVIRATDDNYAAMVSVIMAVYASGQQIQVASSSCSGNYALIDNISAR